MTDAQPTPTRKPRPLVTQLMIALVVTLIVTGSAFWSGYSTLKGPYGWVGYRGTVPTYLLRIQKDLAEYHDEHGVYPETLREVYDEVAAKQNYVLTDEDYNRSITVYRHPVTYVRTDTGWQITDFGNDGKPGGIGLDADMIITHDMDEDHIYHEVNSGKYNATFEQVRTAKGIHCAQLLSSSLVFGILVFIFTLQQVTYLKKQHIAKSLIAAILITIAAIYVGGIITALHTVATGH